MKDFHDILHLSHQGVFALEDLAQAISKTFLARGTPVPTGIVSWGTEYTESHAAMWRSYLMKVGEPGGLTLSEVAKELHTFLAPALTAAQEHRSGKARWNPAKKKWEAESTR